VDQVSFLLRFSSHDDNHCAKPAHLRHVSVLQKRDTALVTYVVKRF